MPVFPEPFWQRLSKIIPAEHLSEAKSVFERPASEGYRLNTLKISFEQVAEILKAAGISYSRPGWSAQALTIPEAFRDHPRLRQLMEEGELYKQSLTSMLPPLVLAPAPGEYILDLCAAPGSKTSQMAAMMENKGLIVAVENIRSRYFKLLSVLQKLNVKNVEAKLTDGRRYRSGTLFDKILVDAPCSSEGRFNIHEPKSYAYWSPRKIKEMAHKQKGLLLNASRLLKAGGTLVYSTCTFAPEENEGAVDWLLRKTERTLKVVPVSLNGIITYSAIARWEKKNYAPETAGCARVLPIKDMEGFFIAKLMKV